MCAEYGRERPAEAALKRLFRLHGLLKDEPAIMLAVDKLFYLGIQDFLPPFFSLYSHVLVQKKVYPFFPFLRCFLHFQPVFVITGDDKPIDAAKENQVNWLKYMFH